MTTPNSEFIKWVRANATADCTKLRLKYASAKGDSIDYFDAITQIECHRKFAAKFPETFAAFPDLYFANLLAGEQASSDRLAAFHAALLPEGLKIVDFTAGQGIDAFYLARTACKVVAVELDVRRAAALRYNVAGLGFENLEVVEGDCREFIDDAIASERMFDAAFIDPARRDDAGNRVYALADCRPDVVELLPRISKICRKLIIKASPMLDISHSLEAIGAHVTAAVALGTPTDCKELLIVVDFDMDSPQEPLIEAVVLTKDGEVRYSYYRSAENSAEMPLGSAALKVGDYLYEAYPEVMKIGVYKLLAAQFGLSIITPNTKLFYSEKLAERFPGHAYKVLEVFPYASKVIKRFKKDHPVVNVATRNFGISADALRTKLGVVDGGNLRLYGITDAGGSKLLVLTTPVTK